MKLPVSQVTALSLGRIAVGTAALARPDVAGRVIGADPAANAQLRYLMRLFGAREVALGAVTLASRGPGRRSAILAGVLVDAADAGTGLLGIRDDDVPRLQGGALVGVASGAVVAGLGGLLSARREARSARKAVATAGSAVADAATTTGRSTRRAARRVARRAERQTARLAA